jgi:hypothetical protein
MHGDIKPSNILLQDDGLSISLADFGLARSFSTNIGAGDVRDRVRRGTVHYMSPQMVKGEGEGLASDIYMFGATLYELLTGRPPYDGESVAEVCRKICEGPPTPILELRPEVPTQLAKIIEKAMDRDDEHRYRTMKTILRHLNELDEVEGRSFWCRLRSKAHLGRRRGVILPLVLAVTALVTTLGLWSASRRPGTEATQGLQPIQQIQIPGVRAWLSSLAGDWDGDGQEDLYIMRDNVLTMVSTDGEVLSEYRMDVPPQVRTLLYMVGDADADRRDEAFPSWSLDGRMFIGMVTQSRFGLMRFEANGTVLEDAMGVKHTTSLVAVGLHDLDGDGHLELLGKLAAGFQMKPRGLCCFSLSSPEPIWTYLTASTVESVAVGDVSGDGKPEIAIGTFAPANGARLANGTDDAHAYLILLNHRGEAVWHRELGDRFCRARVELAGRASDEPLAIFVGLIASREFRPAEGEVGKVLRFDEYGQVVHAYDLGTELCDFRTLRMEETGPLQIIAADRLGRVHLLSSDLALRRQAQLPRQTDFDLATQVQAVDDLDGDGRCEVIVTAYELENRASQVSGEGRVTFTHNHTIYVLNADLTIRARYLLSESRKSFPGIRVLTSDVDRDGCKELIVLTDQALVLRLSS